MACLRRRKDDGKLLYISGSYPASPEGIAASAGMLLDAMAGMGMKEHIKLLTTDLPVIKNHMKVIQYRLRILITGRSALKIYKIISVF